MGKKSKSKRASAQRSAGGGKSVRPAQEQRGLRSELLWLLPALVAGLAVYLNTLHGQFVYDDQWQIVRNTLIQDGSQFWRALTSDVWAVHGGEQSTSNYWRPSFVFWMILNFRCFGLATFGWHLSSILLHLGVVALAFGLLRRLSVSRPVAGAIALLFAVHPVHTESIAWISGATDLILCVALLGSIWFVILLGEKMTPLRWVLGLALYLVALGAKEIAILYPLIVIAVLWRRERDPKDAGVSWARTVSIAWPFAAAAIVYFIARQSILGTVQLSKSEVSFGETILTAPAVCAFYLRQMIFPYGIGPSYPLRVVTAANIGTANFIIPLVVTIVGGWWMLWMAGRSKLACIGLAILVVPLLPTLNIAAFSPELLVHDRYLYVPLLGFLIVTVPIFATLLQRLRDESLSRQGLLVFICAVMASVPLAAQTVRYNLAWTSNLSLWEWGVRSDPTSAFNYQQYGIQLHEAKRLDEAINAFNRAIEILPSPVAYLARGTTFIDQGKFEEAERDLHQLTSIEIEKVTPYTMYQAYEGLAVSYVKQRKLTEAAAALVEGRDRLSQYTAAFTVRLAVVLYQGGQKEEALNQLNAARAHGRTDALPESRLIFYRLGLLNAELGHTQEARDAYWEFLSLTKDILSPDIQLARSKSEDALRNLNR
jgi:tetratricopeptide (TPR) repeat protein